MKNIKLFVVSLMALSLIIKFIAAINSVWKGVFVAPINESKAQSVPC